MNNRIVWGVIAAGLIVVVAGIAFAGSLGSDPTLVDSPLIGREAPAVTLGEFDGEGTVTTDDYAGDVVVVNFWASWCAGCRDEHAALLTASDAYDELGVTFLGINSQDGSAAANAFLDELGRGGAGYQYAVDQGSRAAFAYGVHGMPETFFIDRDGIVVGKVAGPISYELLAATIETMLFER